MDIDNIEITDLKTNLNRILSDKIIAIEKGCKEEVLLELNSQIKGKEIKLVLVCDSNKVSTDILKRNLDVLNYLNNINSISILSNSSKELEEINNVQNITDLNSFKLSGFYNKNINIEVLNKFKNLKVFEIEALSDSKKYKLLDNFNLEKLAIEKLDLAKVEVNPNLKHFKISKELINEKLLAEKYPSIVNVELVNCKKIIDFSFLTDLTRLETIIINNTNIEVFPKVSNSVTKIQLLTNKKLKDIEVIFKLSNLSKIAITDSAVDFEEIIKLSKLNFINFYFRSKSRTENDAFEKIANAQGFNNNLVNW
ncbi:hypothetical protein SD960_20085 [Flavobacterium sp. MMLR14_040]|uniref:hypothetical protein n=1 Tax=Flavobacterium sp. MMLR14_040 TaxID=3093843 RepID=UPI00298F90E7|nr:hypothetical protein [Flavobacterium sp. MMLR14_040]MDW8852412.1 hypothetical protein [Flavobacterium sp. MMLR14_040]